MAEKAVMAAANHPFVLRLVRTFNHPNYLYMLLELVQGGELWSLLYEKLECCTRTPLGGFSAPVAQFYSGCVIDALSHLHALGVAYRDLKPENLLIDDRGFLKVVDFGFAKKLPYLKDGSLCERTYTLCGTPEYLSPELVKNQGHDKAVDYWAIGILVYELLIGATPFADDSQTRIFEKILSSKRYLKFPRGFPPAAADLIRRLLNPNPALRLGNLRDGTSEIKQHLWFEEAGFDWAALRAREVEAPYKPPISDPTDTSNFDEYPEDEVEKPFNQTLNHYFEGF